ncbi:ATP-dependent DNA helicase UvrD2 [Devriesea agamarum]|uniref:ATP-dependent DNA helicase UvrD2 n=1 Tax=Devriesea agamarum TaxID=472569 RepID=UPI00071E16D7|nr:ATP-dependent DNA helicase UvrD2 [Devriesea agamarum]
MATSETSRETPASPEALLDALDPDQREVATGFGQPVCVLAGAGSGKTRAITHRIAYAVATGQQNPRHIMALTFTTKAAAEMRSRLADLGCPGVQARTFHSAALRQLRHFWPRAIGGAMPQIMPHKIAAVAEACRRLHLTVDRAALRDIASEVEWSKVSMVVPEDYAVAAQAAKRSGVAGFDATSIARIIARYEDVKHDSQMIDFEDVLVLTQGILTDRPDIAREVRAQYRHFVVDEYQDVSPLQHRLLSTWLGTSHDVCVVGDASQTIYSFAGATSSYLLNFRRDHPQARVLKLTRNYRSAPTIVSAANAVLDAARGPNRAARLDLVSQRSGGEPPVVECFSDDVEEAEGVAARIASMLDDGRTASSIAILFRTNAQSEGFEQALSARGIGYLVRGGERFFERAEVRRAMVALRGVTKVAGADEDVVRTVEDVLGSQGWAKVAPETTGAVRDRWESLNALVELARTVAARPGAGIVDYVRELEERAEAQNAPTVDGITLASIHAAKGLEWDVVFVVGASEGLLPISMAKDDVAIEEERRLFYVALTRARDVLTVSWAQSRTPGARGSRRPSRFLDGMVPGSGSKGQGRERGPVARRTGRRSATIFSACRVCGQALTDPAQQKVGRCENCPPSYSEELLRALKAWRREVAREAKVPAFVVFTDATLDAIAERTPSSPAELLAIPGVGQAKLERYGEAVFALLADHVAAGS